VARLEPAHAEEQQQPAQADADGREQDVEGDVGRELHAGQNQGVHACVFPCSALAAGLGGETMHQRWEQCHVWSLSKVRQLLKGHEETLRPANAAAHRAATIRARLRNAPPAHRTGPAV